MMGQVTDIMTDHKTNKEDDRERHSSRSNLDSGIFLLIKFRFIKHEMDRAAMTSQRDLLVEYVTQNLMKNSQHRLETASQRDLLQCVERALMG